MNANKVGTKSYFKNIDRAPYELGHLLAEMPADLSARSKLSDDEMATVDAAIDHAGNANSTILSGLEAIGALMFLTAEHVDYQIERGTLEDIGNLVRHLAVEAQFLQGLEGDLRSLRDGQRASPAPLRAIRK